MSVFYVASVDRVIRDRLMIVIRSDQPTDMMIIEKEAETLAKNYSEISPNDDQKTVVVSLARVEMLDEEPDQLRFEFA